MTALSEAGDAGLCDHELEKVTGLQHTTASARRRELVLKGLVVETGERRTTPSGRSAKAWRLA
jgi:predicted transcriptional regulator